MTTTSAPTPPPTEPDLGGRSQPRPRWPSSSCSIVVAGPLILFDLARDRWFVLDEWDFLDRSADRQPARSLPAPQRALVDAADHRLSRDVRPRGTASLLGLPGDGRRAAPRRGRAPARRHAAGGVGPWTATVVAASAHPLRRRTGGHRLGVPDRVRRVARLRAGPADPGGSRRRVGRAGTGSVSWPARLRSCARASVSPWWSWSAISVWLRRGWRAAAGTRAAAHGALPGLVGAVSRSVGLHRAEPRAACPTSSGRSLRWDVSGIVRMPSRHSGRPRSWRSRCWSCWCSGWCCAGARWLEPCPRVPERPCWACSVGRWCS